MDNNTFLDFYTNLLRGERLYEGAEIGFAPRNILTALSYNGRINKDMSNIDFSATDIRGYRFSPETSFKNCIFTRSSIAPVGIGKIQHAQYSSDGTTFDGNIMFAKGKQLFTAVGNEIIIYDLSGTELYRITCNEIKIINSFHFSNDMRYIAVEEKLDGDILLRHKYNLHIYENKPGGKQIRCLKNESFQEVKGNFLSVVSSEAQTITIPHEFTNKANDIEITTSENISDIFEEINPNCRKLTSYKILTYDTILLLYSDGTIESRTVSSGKFNWSNCFHEEISDHLICSDNIIICVRNSVIKIDLNNGKIIDALSIKVNAEILNQIIDNLSWLCKELFCNLKISATEDFCCIYFDPEEINEALDYGKFYLLNTNERWEYTFTTIYLPIEEIKSRDNCHNSIFVSQVISLNANQFLCIIDNLVSTSIYIFESSDATFKYIGPAIGKITISEDRKYIYDVSDDSVRIIGIEDNSCNVFNQNSEKGFYLVSPTNDSMLFNNHILDLKRKSSASIQPMTDEVMTYHLGEYLITLDKKSGKTKATAWDITTCSIVTSAFITDDPHSEIFGNMKNKSIQFLTRKENENTEGEYCIVEIASDLSHYDHYSISLSEHELFNVFYNSSTNEQTVERRFHLWKDFIITIDNVRNAKENICKHYIRFENYRNGKITKFPIEDDASFDAVYIHNSNVLVILYNANRNKLLRTVMYDDHLSISESYLISENIIWYQCIAENDICFLGLDSIIIYSISDSNVKKIDYAPLMSMSFPTLFKPDNSSVVLICNHGHDYNDLPYNNYYELLDLNSMESAMFNLDASPNEFIQYKDYVYMIISKRKTLNILRAHINEHNDLHEYKTVFEHTNELYEYQKMFIHPSKRYIVFNDTAGNADIVDLESLNISRIYTAFNDLNINGCDFSGAAFKSALYDIDSDELKDIIRQHGGRIS